MRLLFVVGFSTLVLGTASSQIYTQQWSKFVARGATVYAEDMLMAPSGSYMVLESTLLNGVSKSFVTNTSRSGSQVWSRDLSAQVEGLRKIVVAPDNSVYGIGYRTVGNLRQSVLVKVNSNGTVAFAFDAKMAAVNKSEEPDDLALDSDGNVFLLATTQRDDGSGLSATKISVINNTPLRLWTRHSTAVATFEAYGTGIYATPGGGCAVAGGVSDALEDGNYQKCLAWRINGNGTVANETEYDVNSGFTELHSSGIDAAGNLFFAGDVDQQTFSTIYISKVLPNGTQGWRVLTRVLAGETESVRKLKVDHVGNVTYCGSRRNVNQQYVGFVGRQSNAGSSMWYSTFQDPNGGNVFFTSMAFDQNAEVYVGGTNNSTRSMIVRKYNAIGALRWGAVVTKPSGNPAVSGVQVATHIPSGDVGILGEVALTPAQMGLANFRQAPVPIADVFSVKKNTQLVNKLVTTNDRYYQGSTATIAIAVNRGTLSFGTNGLFTYTPPANYTGQATFTYRLTKPGLTPNIAKVTFNIK